MKITTLTTAAAVTALMATPALAQDSGLYGTLGAKTIEFDTYSLEGRLGYNFNEIFSVEGEGAIGIIGEDEVGFDVEEDYSLGGYIRAGIPVAEQFKLFGRVGYVFSEFSADGPTINASDNFEGFAYGGGVEFNLTERNALRLDYTRVDYDNEGFDVGTADTVSAAFVVKF